MSQFGLKTGDLLLFDNGSKGVSGFISYLIKYFTQSNITHVAVVLKDPYFLHPTLKGYYVWESNWEGEPDPQDGKIKFGVQITPFDEIYKKYKQTNGRVYVRRIGSTTNLFTLDVMEKIHENVYSKMYDIVPSDWLEGLWRRDSHPQKTDRFWCSALVGYIYTQCGILRSSTDWSILRPSDFTMDSTELHYTGRGILGAQEQI
jgi:cell wall-associated NlpC family hydrolase